MASDSRKYIAGIRKYYQQEIETMIRQMKIEGGTLDECMAELKLLAEFIRSQADVLEDGWANLRHGTCYETLEQGEGETGAADSHPTGFVASEDTRRN